MSLHNQLFLTPTLKVGLGGNYYVLCDDSEQLVGICYSIDKSINSIYFNKKYGCYAIRVKNKKQKETLKLIFNAPVV